MCEGLDSNNLLTTIIPLVQVDADSKAVESYRLLTLKQFLAVFKSLQTQTAAIKSEDSHSTPDSSEASSPIEEHDKEQCSGNQRLTVTGAQFEQANGAD